MLPRKAIIKFSCLLVCTNIAGQICRAQQNLRLKDVAKIDLITKGPVVYGGYEKTELKLIGGRWQIYRTFESKDNFDRGTSECIYIGDATTCDLKKLIKIINKGDTVLSVKSFHIDKNILVKYIDSISRRSKLPEGERSAFIRFLRSDDSLQKALTRCIRMIGHSDYAYKFIDIITKNNDTIKIFGKGSKPYYLPWTLNGKLNYHPDIDIIFNSLLNSKANRSFFDRHLYEALCKCAYMECFHKNRVLDFFYYNISDILPKENFTEVKNE